MVAITSVVHFSIPVSDVERSTRFYTEIVGCRHLATVNDPECTVLEFIELTSYAGAS
jgi:predicted enzyme related to lactoylglutathione lyase